MRIGMIGSGFMAHEFVKNIKDVKGGQLYAIYGRHLEKLQEFKDFKKYYLKLEDFLKDEKIDLVYICVSNSLHYEFAYQALLANKHVMLEKPFCTSYQDSKKLIALAKKKNLMLFETIMTKHAPLYKKAQGLINKVGEVKLINVNFSQYSRKYDKFKQGIILPAFDYKMAGGALMDLGVYNIHFVVDSFGLPKKAAYYPNVEKKVDTSGVLILDYGKFKATLTNAKDSKSDSFAYIQGDKGVIKFDTTTSRCAHFTLEEYGQEVKEYSQEDTSEFSGFKPMYEDIFKVYKKKDYETCYKWLEDTLKVQRVLDKAREANG